MFHATYWDWKLEDTQETQIVLTKVPAYGPVVLSVFYHCRLKFNTERESSSYD